MKIKIALLAAFFLLACAFTAQNCSAADTRLIDKIKNSYEQTDSFSANFEQNLVHKESGSTETRNGKIYFQKPLRVRWQTAKPHEEVLVVTDNEIWDYLPDEEIVYRYAPEVVQDSRSIIQVLTGQAALNRDFEVKDSGRENSLTKLLLLPNDPTPQMVEAVIWVDPESGFIRRALVTDFYGNTNDVKLSNFQANAGISPSQFRFTPPEGIEVEDHVGKKLPERELFK